MKVSVIVVNWNRRDLLRNCLNSLKIQTATEFDIIVVDNGSVDGSPEMVEREYSGVRLIRNCENRGFCAANNQGIQASQAEYVALLNNEAEAEAGRGPQEASKGRAASPASGGLSRAPWLASTPSRRILRGSWIDRPW